MEMIDIICKYQEWLTDNSTIKLIYADEEEQVYSIVTPCMDIDNDLIEVYIRIMLNSNKIIITDDKSSINKLTMQGLKDEKKILLFKRIVASNDFYITDDFLYRERSRLF